MLPEAFLAADAILILATNVITGLEVREPVITRNVNAQMPFLATERWLMLGVTAGGDRQELHEVIRSLSREAAEAVSTGRPNDLLERLASHPAFARIPFARLKAELDPVHYTGRAAEQVEELLGGLERVLSRAAALAAVAPSEEVRV